MQKMTGVWQWTSAAALVFCFAGATSAADDWPYYGYDAGGTRSSRLTQIDRSNVAQLKVAWTFHTGDIDAGHGSPRSGFETTPVMVEGTLYLTTPFNRVVALDPATGKQRWAYDPRIARGSSAWYGDGLINRGAAVWLDAQAAKGRLCRRRVFEATLDARLIALDAATGKPCSDFGREGEVSLRDVPRYHIGDYHMTSAPTVIDDVVVVGSAIDDNDSVEMADGVVRAFDARTGALKWSWEPLPANTASGNEAAGQQIWRTGAGNAWSGIVADPGRHLVFVPTGSASPDFFGGFRPGDDRWANSVVALDARTGEMKWGFQLVHHDLWDYDSAAPPLLATIPHGGRDVPVVVQGNKSGFLYVLDRDTGVPVFGVEERRVETLSEAGERVFPTQPFPLAPPTLVPQTITEADAWGPTPAAKEWCRAFIASHAGGMFTPPSVNGTIVRPGFLGGMNWSGYAYDSVRHLLIVPTNDLPYILKLIPEDQWIAATKHREDGWEYNRMLGAPFGMMRRAFFSPARLPCVAPPWGMLSAVDLATGKIRWQVPLGSMSELTHGDPRTPPGSINLGGAMVTAGGLVFVAGTLDKRIRAFDIEIGREIWSAELPATAHAMPMTYQAGTKQYVVIAAGGSAKIDEEAQSDAIVAFALP